MRVRPPAPRVPRVWGFSGRGMRLAMATQSQVATKRHPVQPQRLLAQGGSRARSVIDRFVAVRTVVGGPAVLKQIAPKKLTGPGPLQPGIDVDGRDGESFGVPGVGHDLSVGRDDAAVAV